MKYVADVVHLSIRPGGERFSVPLEARDYWAAARAAAHIAAERKYQDKGLVGTINQQAKDGLFMAQIGIQARSASGIATVGESVLIFVYPQQEGAQ
jgi:hypothetical protein